MSMLNEVRPSNDVQRDRSFKGRLKELIPWKGDNAKEIVRKVIYISAVAVLVVSAVNAIEYKFGTSDLWEDKDYLSELYHGSGTTPDAENTDNTDNQQSVVPTTDSDSSQTDASGEAEQNPEDSKYPEGMLERFKALYDLNPEIIGWLTIDGLTDENGENYIDYPVMQPTHNQ